MEAIIGQFIKRSDTTDYWLKILHKLMATDQFFTESLKDQLEFQNLKPEIVLRSDDVDRFVHGSWGKHQKNGLWHPGKLESSSCKIWSVKGRKFWNWRSNSLVIHIRAEFILPDPRIWVFFHYLRHFCCPIQDKYYPYVSSGDFSSQRSFWNWYGCKVHLWTNCRTCWTWWYVPWVCKFFFCI